MSTQSCSTSLKAENWTGSAPLQLQVLNVDEHVGIGPLLTVWSRLHPQAEAIMGAWGRKQDTHECERDLSDILGLQEGTKYTKLPWI